MLKKPIPLWAKVLLGIVLGGALGALFPEVGKDIRWIGTIFINLLTMMIVPLVFFSVVSGILMLPDLSSLGRIGLRAGACFLVTVLLATTLGLGMALFFQPGAGVELTLEDGGAMDAGGAEAPTLTQMLVNFFPKSFFGVFVSGNVIQLIVLSILIGVFLARHRQELRKTIALIEEGAVLFFKIIAFIIALTPYGVFALTAWLTATQGFDLLQSLLKLIGVIAITYALQLGIYAFMIRVIGGLPLWPFLRKSMDFQMVAFSTSSSAATLPTTMDVCQRRLGVSKATTGLVVPLGATINMDGSASYLVIAAVFVGQVTGFQFGFEDYMAIILAATLGSIGAAALPSAGMVMLVAVLASVGLPLGFMPILIGIDRFPDMMRTVVNVTGDATVATLVDKWENRLDEARYRQL